jgi:hypothetical protein
VIHSFLCAFFSQIGIGAATLRKVFIRATIWGVLRGLEGGWWSWCNFQGTSLLPTPSISPTCTVIASAPPPRLL